MANYMAEVAKMLGVEMNQDFKCQESCGTYRVTEYGLTCNGSYGSDSLLMLLNGMLTIVQKPWRPKVDERYYSIAENGLLEENICVWDHLDIILYKLGNCYRTKEEAEAHRDKWLTFYTSDEILEV